MSTVIETLAPYIHSLVYDKRVCKQTIRGKELALRYFSALYGNTETSELKASDMYVFYENLKTLEKKKKNDTGVHSHFSLTFVYKVMVNVRAYITWLASNGYLKNLSPADVPVYKVARNVPEYLSKEELKKIMHFLEDNIIIAQQSGVLRKIYTAHFWRALVRMLYTSWLRNAEIRSLTFTDIYIEQLSGSILWKGNKLAVFTFDEITKNALKQYLNVRKELYPNDTSPFLFISAVSKNDNRMSEYGLNILLKKIGKKAGVHKEIHAHIFRHSLATHLVMDGWNIVQVRDKMRHDNLSTTSIYTHSNPLTLLELTKNVGSWLI